jgi:hypothetical protein
MAEGSKNSKLVHERRARGERAPRPSRRSGFSHTGPGYHDVSGPAKRSEEGKQSIRAKKRKIRRKEEG